MFCGECGTPNPDTNQFCRNCGKPLGRRQQAAPGTPAAVPVPSGPPAPVTAVPQAPSPVVQQPAAVPAGAPAPVPKRRWNWLGIVSVIPGIVSLGILPVLLGSGAILLGLISILLFRKATGRIGIAGIIGIVLGIAAIAITILLG